MYISFRATLMFCLTFAIALLPVFGDQVGALDRLADKADAVVVGEIQSGQQAGHSVTLVLLVVRAIKGDLANGTLLNVSGEVRNSLTAQLVGKTCGLWFLKQNDSRWTVLPVLQSPSLLDTGAFVPFLKTELGGPISTTLLPETVGDKVASELVTALKQGNLGGLQLHILSSTVTMFGERPFITDLFRALRAESDPNLKFIGLTGLLGTSDERSAMAEIADNVDSIAKLRGSTLLGRKICGNQNPDPAVVSSLGRISLYPGMAACAATALAAIHTRQTLPFLAQLLDSKDPAAREQAVRGLSRFVENLPIRQRDDNITGKSLIPQGPAPYRSADTDRFSLSRRLLTLTGESDAEYVQFWKLWWARMQNELGRETAVQSVK